MYHVKEIFYTLQGEGANAGTPAVFCRFAGCNLWSGREDDRAQAQCTFCDTDFVGTDGDGGGRFETPEDLVARCTAALGGVPGPHLVVLTGGEPMLQVDTALIEAFHAADFAVAIETNGTIPVNDDIDWICVSPKAGTQIAQRSGDELKLVYPQSDLLPEAVRDFDFDHFYLQPLDGPDLAENTRRTIAYCKANPPWRLSIQTHKILGIR